MRHSPRPVATGLLTGLVLAGGLAACAGGSGEAATGHRSEVVFAPVGLEEASAVPGVVAANDRLGLAMLDLGSGGNVAVSPFSALVALSMLAEGARGETAQAFDEALGAAGGERSEAVSALRDELLRHDGDPALAGAAELPDEVLLHLADRIVMADGFAPLPEFLDTLARHYDAGTAVADLGSQTGVDELSRWIDEETGGLIEKSAITPDPALVLVLQDVLLFAGRWEVAFDPEATVPGPFAAPGGSVEVQMMEGAVGAAVVQRDGWVAVRLPYDDAVVADLLLPPVGVDPATVAPELLTVLDAALPLDTLRPVRVPRIELAQSPLTLDPALYEVGLGELFDRPDLTGIIADPDSGLRLQQAKQQVILRLDEEGGVAAAATELGVDLVSGTEVMPISFDRPFLLRLAHDDTDLTLFLAAVRDPS